MRIVGAAGSSARVHLTPRLMRQAATRDGRYFRKRASCCRPDSWPALAVRRCARISDTQYFSTYDDRTAIALREYSSSMCANRPRRARPRHRAHQREASTAGAGHCFSAFFHRTNDLTRNFGRASAAADMGRARPANRSLAFMLLYGGGEVEGGWTLNSMVTPGTQRQEASISHPLHPIDCRCQPPDRGSPGQSVANQKG